MTGDQYPHASTESLDVIEANECGGHVSLATARFQRLFLELRRLSTALAVAEREAARLKEDIVIRPLDRGIESRGNPLLTKAGGLSFDVWLYILRLENRAHGHPLAIDDGEGWLNFYADDYTPHAALEEDFNSGF